MSDIQLHDQKKSGECGGELMLYLHIPFCVRKCAYCDFLSGPATDDIIQAYVEALCLEIKVRSDEFTERIITSIYLGGGTPSLLSSKQVDSIMECIRKHFRIATGCEITMECNPGTAEFDTLSAYFSAGINRLSIGLQSADDNELASLGRIHRWDDFLSVYDNAYRAGFRNVNVDLISAIPGQTPVTWEKILKKVLALEPSPKHFSVYSLIIEEGTPFYVKMNSGEFIGAMQIPSEDEDREMYRLTGKLLQEHGYEQYEISNYAKPGYECRHNCGYWRRKDYLGLGIGSASLIWESRYSNRTDLNGYIADPIGGRTSELLTVRDVMAEFMFLGLRMNEGVAKREFYEQFGKSMDEIYGDVICKHVKDGLLIVDERNVRLTDKGMDLSNYVMADFI